MLLDKLPGVCFVARSRQLVMDCQTHVVSLAFMVRCPGQFVSHEVLLAAQPAPHWAGDSPPNAFSTAAFNSSGRNGLCRIPTAPNFWATDSMVNAAAFPDMAMMATFG